VGLNEPTNPIENGEAIAATNTCAVAITTPGPETGPFNESTGLASAAFDRHEARSHNDYKCRGYSSPQWEEGYSGRHDGA
jgi:hypothetical protein